MLKFHTDFVVHSEFSGETPVKLYISKYKDNDRLYVGLLCQDEDGDVIPFANLTVNIEDMCMPFGAYLDVNNAPWSVDFVEKYDLAKFTGYIGRSGYCEYPLFLFDEEKLKKLCPDDYEKYFQ